MIMWQEKLFNGVLVGFVTFGGILGVDIGGGYAASPSPIETPQENNNIQQEVEKLKRELRKKDELINQYKTQIDQLQEQINKGKKYNKTQENEPKKNGNNFLLTLAILIIFGEIGLLAYRNFKGGKTTKGQLFDNYEFQGEKENLKTEINEQDDLVSLPENDPILRTSVTSSDPSYPDQYSKEFNLSNQSSNTQVDNLVNTGLNSVSYPSYSEEETMDYNLDYIQTVDDLASLYNQNYRALYNYVVTVTATKESVERKRAGYDSPIYFTDAENGNYWVTSIPQLERPYYCLVPKGNLIIDEHKYKAVQEVFVCSGYKERSSNKFVLNKPAIVACDSSGYWLHKQGELSFY